MLEHVTDHVVLHLVMSAYRPLTAMIPSCGFMCLPEPIFDFFKLLPLRFSRLRKPNNAVLP